MKLPKEGDYVLGTKWSDGDAADPWAVGFYAGRTPAGRCDVVDGEGVRIYYGGFRRVGLITAAEGAYLLTNAKHLEQGCVHLWKFLRRLRAKASS